MGHITSFPVSIKQVPKLKVAQALQFALPKEADPAEEGVQLQAPRKNARRRNYTGTPLQIHFDGGFAKGVGVIGFHVVGPGGEERVKVG